MGRGHVKQGCLWQTMSQPASHLSQSGLLYRVRTVQRSSPSSPNYMAKQFSSFREKDEF